jgi:UbiD family decarboxylase
MPKDLRSFVDTLTTEYPEEIVTIADGPFDLARGEAVALLHHLMKMEKRPMAVFEHVKALSGERWPGCVAYQLAGTWTKVGAGYGIPRETLTLIDILEETSKRVNRPIPPVTVSPREAPVKQVVWQEGEFDLFQFPAYTQNEKDATPGNITGVMIVRDPDTHRYNLSWHRDRVVDRERIVTAIDGERHIGTVLRKYRERGFDRMPVAQVFGHHVLVGLAAAVRAGLDVDEYDFAGGILGEPLRLVPSTTWGDDLLIPADAEVVMEGYISTSEREQGGSWGDFFRYYAPDKPRPVLRPVCVNLREAPIFEHTWVGQYVYSDVAHCAFLRDYLRKRFANVGAVNVVGPATFVIQYHPEHQGEVRRLASMAHSYGDFVKHVIVVDHDVDPFDLGMVFWSIGARVNASRQAYIVDGLSSLQLDPSGQEGMARGEGVGGLVIDATVPVDREFLEIAQPSPAVLESVDPYRYLSREQVDRLATGHTTRPWARL